MRPAIFVIPATMVLMASGSALKRSRHGRNQGIPDLDIISDGFGFGFGFPEGPKLTEAEKKEIEDMVKKASENFDKLIKDCAKLDKVTKDAPSMTDAKKPDESKKAVCDDLNHFLQWEKAQHRPDTKPTPFNPDDYKPRKLCCNGLCVQTTNRYATPLAPGKHCPAVNYRTCYNPITAGCCDAPHYC